MTGLTDVDTRGFGILGMRERVETHNGMLEVVNHPSGRGVTVKARFPSTRVET